MKKVLVLDLDETLIHATQHPMRTADFNVGKFYVYKRPYLESFLTFCYQYFELIVWTSSTKNYAEEIINHIGIRNSFFLSRESCVQKRNIELDEIVWIKDLKKLKRKGYSLHNILVIDDSPEKLQRNYGNLIRVKPFLGEEDDNELLLLQKYLTSILNVNDFRSIEKREWKNKILEKKQ